MPLCANGSTAAVALEAHSCECPLRSPANHCMLRNLNLEAPWSERTLVHIWLARGKRPAHSKA